MNTMNKASKRSLLSAVVVAMLALVAFTGIVMISENSEAATTYTLVSGDVTLDPKQTSMDFILDYGVPSSINVPEGVAFSGTVAIGYLNEFNQNYVEFAVSKFDGFTGKIERAGADTMSVASNSTVQSTITVEKGFVSVRGGNFKIVAADLNTEYVGSTYSSTNLYVGISENVGVVNGVVDGPEESVTLSGTGGIGELSVYDAKVVIAEGAEISAWAEPDYYTEYEFTLPYTGEIRNLDVSPSSLTASISTGNKVVVKLDSAYIREFTLTAEFYAEKAGTSLTSDMYFFVKQKVTVVRGEAYVLDETKFAGTPATEKVAKYDKDSSRYEFPIATFDMGPLVGNDINSTMRVAYVDGSNNPVPIPAGVFGYDYTEKVYYLDASVFGTGGILDGMNVAKLFVQFGDETDPATYGPSTEMYRVDLGMKKDGTEYKDGTLSVNKFSGDFTRASASIKNTVAVAPYSAGIYNMGTFDVKGTLNFDAIKWEDTTPGPTPTPTAGSIKIKVEGGADLGSKKAYVTCGSVSKILNSGDVAEFDVDWHAGRPITDIVFSFSESSTSSPNASINELNGLVVTASGIYGKPAIGVNWDPTATPPGTPQSFTVDDGSENWLNVEISGKVTDATTPRTTVGKFVYNTIENVAPDGFFTIDGKDFDGKVLVASDVEANAKIQGDGKTNGVWYTQITAANYVLATYGALAAMLADSEKVTIEGDIYIGQDMELVSAKGKATLTFSTGAHLHIGVPADSGESGTKVTVTAPEGTVLNFTGSITDSSVDVDLGKFIVLGVTSFPYAGESNIKADVAIENRDEKKVTYTDVATSLAEAEPGSTIKLKGPGPIYLSEDAEIPAGITLDINGNDFVIGYEDSSSTPAKLVGKKLTITGTLTNSNSAVKNVIVPTDGETVVNNDIEDTANFVMQIEGGTLTVNADKTIGSPMFNLVWGNLYDKGIVKITSDITVGVPSTAITVPEKAVTNIVISGKAVAETEFTITAWNFLAVLSKFNLTVDAGGELSGPVNVYGRGDVDLAKQDTFTILGVAKDLNFISMGNGGNVIVGASATSTGDDLTSTGLKVKKMDVVNLTVNGGSVIVTDEDNQAISGKLTMNGGSFVFEKLPAVVVINDAVITGNATLKCSLDGEQVKVNTLSVGSMPTQMGATNTTATVGAEIVQTATIYGTADNVKLTPDTLSKTVFYVIDKRDNQYVYATEYAAGTTSASVIVKDVPDLEGYLFDGWFNATRGGTLVVATNIGDNASLYGLFTIKTYNITYNYLDKQGNTLEGAKFVVNGVPVAAGLVTYDYGEELSIQLVCDSGYKIDGKPVISVDGASPATGETIKFTVKSDATVSVDFKDGNGIVPASGDDSGLSLVEILLIVLIIIAAIVMVAVVARLARS